MSKIVLTNQDTLVFVRDTHGHIFPNWHHSQFEEFQDQPFSAVFFMLSKTPQIHLFCKIFFPSGVFLSGSDYTLKVNMDKNFKFVKQLINFSSKSKTRFNNSK